MWKKSRGKCHMDIMWKSGGTTCPRDFHVHFILFGRNQAFLEKNPKLWRAPRPLDLIFFIWIFLCWIAKDPTYGCRSSLKNLDFFSLKSLVSLKQKINSFWKIIFLHFYMVFFETMVEFVWITYKRRNSCKVPWGLNINKFHLNNYFLYN